MLFDSYNKGINVDKLFKLIDTGIKTERDVFTIQLTNEEIKVIVEDLKTLEIEEIRKKYNLKKDGRGWQLACAKKDIITNKIEISKIQYRPFDFRYTAYTGVTKGFMAYPREKIMSHLIKDNLAFVTTRLNRGLNQGYNFISKNILDLHLLDSAADSLQTLPLYIYPETNGQQTIELSVERIPNLNSEIIEIIEDELSMAFVPEKMENACELTKGSTFAPIDILDYIYAVLHSPTYREKYKEFLKIDFPRVPYPKNHETFWKLVELGKQIREIHLLESPKVEEYITSYPVDGDNIITTKISKKDWEITDQENQLGRIWINKTQYFENIPLIAWEFYIGGYQPAQKWLKDRQGRKLSFEDILHYQKIIIALSETGRLMKEIDKIEIK